MRRGTSKGVFFAVADLRSPAQVRGSRDAFCCAWIAGSDPMKRLMAWRCNLSQQDVFSPKAESPITESITFGQSIPYNLWMEVAIAAICRDRWVIWDAKELVALADPHPWQRHHRSGKPNWQNILGRANHPWPGAKKGDEQDGVPFAAPEMPRIRDRPMRPITDPPINRPMRNGSTKAERPLYTGNCVRDLVPRGGTRCGSMISRIPTIFLKPRRWLQGTSTSVSTGPPKASQCL